MVGKVAVALHALALEANFLVELQRAFVVADHANGNAMQGQRSKGIIEQQLHHLGAVTLAPRELVAQDDTKIGGAPGVEDAQQPCFADGTGVFVQHHGEPYPVGIFLHALEPLFQRGGVGWRHFPN